MGGGTAAILTGFIRMLSIMVLHCIRTGQASCSMSGTSIVLELPDTKTSARKTITEKAMITCPFASLLLLTLCEDKSAGDKVFDSLSAKVFRSRLRQLAAARDLEDLFISPHSLRRGLATHMFRQDGKFRSGGSCWTLGECEDLPKV